MSHDKYISLELYDGWHMINMLTERVARERHGHLEIKGTLVMNMRGDKHDKEFLASCSIYIGGNPHTL